MSGYINYLIFIQYMAKMISFSQIDSTYAIIDVRTFEEYEEVYLENTINIPLDFSKKFIDEVSQIDKKIAFICVSGTRARYAAQFYELHTKKQGYYIINNIYSLVS